MESWLPIIDSGFTQEKREWLSEYAEMHKISEQNINIPNISIPSSSGLTQFNSPVAMKIAAQTIGLDLVAVQPCSSPKIDMLWLDFKYGDLETKVKKQIIDRLKEWKE